MWRGWVAPLLPLHSCLLPAGPRCALTRLNPLDPRRARTPSAPPQAYQRACRNLYPIPRYNDHTITEPAQAKYGQVGC